MALNPYQKNALEVEMRHLEQALLQAREFMRHMPEDGLLTNYRPVAEENRARLEALIDRMLAEIAVVVKKYDLQPRVEDIGVNIYAEMAGAWSDLYDMFAHKLKRYGHVDPALGETLDPHIKLLINLAREIGEAAKDRH